ncbi:MULTISPECIES: tannase/feruloyl esterase family alpha/beta hydrolase [Frankia]|uniref:tannase/feruloyl esterase family alpha/beta hydrolase n=1 Tax=Frankia TaxID=1854 RepID=UPI0005A5590B|nr:MULTISPECIES: tannase/feruloyl esterase family alpha/beta hydrolase [Frankia]
MGAGVAPALAAEPATSAAVPAAAVPAAVARPGCDAAALQRTVGADTTITAAASATTPNTATRYCKVDGYVATSGPAGSNHVNFSAALPDRFVGRYLFNGIGGAAGSIPPIDEAQLAAGWAQAGTDAGNQGSVLDYRFAVDRTKALDWASRGVHVTTVATQAVTRAYYGLPTQAGALHRYISGCSGGGRMGLVEASLYPTEYDGVLAGAPGSNSLNILKFGQIVSYLLAHPDAWVSPDQLGQLEKALIAKYDARDGAADGFIRDPGVVDTDFAPYGLFTPAQLDLLRLITGELKVGDRSYPGFSASNVTGWSAFLTGTQPPSTWGTQPPPALILFDTVTRALFGADYDFRTQFDFADPADPQSWATTFDQVFPGQNAAADSYDRFRDAGGKLLIWHGASDNGISVFDTIGLYGKVAAHQHGYADTQRWARLFTVPGLFHCFGGPGAQDTPAQGLAALADWVEHGQVPRTIVVHSAADQPKADFLLCPYPAHPIFLGGADNPRHLNALDAENWRCSA